MLYCGVDCLVAYISINVIALSSKYMLHVLQDLKNNKYVTVLFQFTEPKQDYRLTNSRENNVEDETLCI